MENHPTLRGVFEHWLVGPMSTFGMSEEIFDEFLTFIHAEAKKDEDPTLRRRQGLYNYVMSRLVSDVLAKVYKDFNMKDSGQYLSPLEPRPNPTEATLKQVNLTREGTATDAQKVAQAESGVLTHLLYFFPAYKRKQAQQAIADARAKLAYAASA